MNKKNNILENIAMQALCLFAVKSYHKTTFKDIAAKSKISSVQLKIYFPTKIKLAIFIIELMSKCIAKSECFGVVRLAYDYFKTDALDKVLLTPFFLVHETAHHPDVVISTKKYIRLSLSMMKRQKGFTSQIYDELALDIGRRILRQEVLTDKRRMSHGEH